MTREELIRVLCPSFMAYKCEKLVVCNDCKEKMNKWIDKYDKQIRKNVIDEVIALARAEIDFESQAEQKRFVEFMETLKEQK